MVTRRSTTSILPLRASATVLLMAAVMSSSALARAATLTWQVASGDWMAASNWSGGALPTSPDTALVDNGGTASVTQVGPICNTLALGDSTGAGALNMTAGSLGVGFNLYCGQSGVGTFAQSGGTTTVYDSYLGYNSGSNGSYNLSGGSLAEYSLCVGNSGTGAFTQSGGTNKLSAIPFLDSTHAIGLLCLGYSTGSSGSYNLSAGLLTSQIETVGFFGSGTFNQSGGTNSITLPHFNTPDDLPLCLGYNGGSNGCYTLGGSAVLSAQGECLGFFGTGTFTQSGGRNDVGELYINRGTYTQSGGTNTVNGRLSLGSPFVPSSATYNLDGGLLIVPWFNYINSYGVIAAFNFNGGTLQASLPFSANFPMTLGTSGGGATFDTAGFDATLSGSLSGPGSLTKIGSGALILGTVNTYSGNTLIGGGTIALCNPLAMQNSALDTSGSGTLSFGTLTAGTLGGLAGTGNLGLANTARRNRAQRRQ